MGVGLFLPEKPSKQTQEPSPNLLRKASKKMKRNEGKCFELSGGGEGLKLLEVSTRTQENL